MRTDSGASLILLERLRQITSEGWTFEHDSQHVNGELVGAAVVYAVEATPGINEAMDFASSLWPEGWAFKPEFDPIRTLTKAGALIAAEIDRLLAKKRDEL